MFHEDNERVRFLDPDTEDPKLLAEVRKGPWYLEPIVMLDLNTGLRRRNLIVGTKSISPGESSESRVGQRKAGL